MSDNEYEKFEVTDYDLDNEFNINRPRRKLTKHQQIYGIWADDSDNDSEEEGRGRHGRRGRAAGKPKDYTAPVSFVAGGVQQAGKKKKNEEKAKQAEINDDNITDEEDERPSFGRKPLQMPNADSSDSSENSSEEEAAAPAPRQQISFQQQATGMPNSKNMGAWQKHTRGIGAKLLLQMGYKPGMGLGKDLQGISQPVEAHVRKGRGAIGAYGPETPASVGGKPANLKADVEARKEIKDFNDKSGKWKRNGENRQEKNKRYYYKSVEEVIEKGQKNTNVLSDKLSKKLSNVPVIDMTGPEKRVLSGYHAIGLTKMQDEDLYESATNTDANVKKSVNFAVPELMHNIQLVVDMCEQEIISIDNIEREASEKKEAMEYELKNLEKIVILEQNHISTLNKALVLVEELMNGGENLTLDRAEKLFIELQHDYAAEYVEFHLADLAAGIIAPLVKSTLEEWQPLKQPTKHIDTIKRWRAILDPDNSTNIDTAADSSRNVFDPYSSVIWAGVIPSFRACANEWNPKIHQPMAALLDTWAPLFPNWILDSVLEQLVLSRISAGVREWDPLTDTVPIHIWILPWNSILGKKMEEYVFPSIREKLGVALQAWMPQDRSARAMLSPWKGAFNEAEMQIFLLQHILPKLQLILNEFVINPLQQDLELWNQVWEWHEIVPTMLMAQLLDQYFFNKWMQVLALWLNQAPDFTEISRWYTGWKGMFSEELLREPSIKEHFRRALEMMHRATENLVAVNAGSYTGVNNTAPLGAETAQAPLQPPLPTAYLDMQMNAQAAQLEFKELVSQKCADRGILFAPLPGRREMGKQIYRVGKLYCYIDRNVCMISDSSVQNWCPTSLAQLLDRAAIGLI